MSLEQNMERILEESNLSQLRELVRVYQNDHRLVLLKGNAKAENNTNRGSIYRGVSRNGKQFQVMVMSNNLKYYSGHISSEELAARIYDRYALQTMGLRAKTNFPYTSQELAVIIADIDSYLSEHQLKYGESRKSIELKGRFLINQ
jgi:hypothetical protein